MAVVVVRDLWGREERWIKHYSSSHSILLVGEGDFSFSLCLAMAFGSATNIIATSLDSYVELIMKYKNASINLTMLEFMGASLLHGVDATQMKNLPALQTKRFHRIIYNFPHAGFYGKEDDPKLIMMHRNLVRGFFMNASTMLCPDGEIHVSHKTTSPFSTWKIDQIALECSLMLTEQDEFHIEHYPGYNNKRGSSSRCDESFPLGDCSTFKFKPICPTTADILNMMMSNLDLTTNVQIPFDRFYNNINMSNECYWIFGAYLNHVEETFGSISYDMDSSLRETLRVGFETYMSAEPGRESSGYVGVLEELHHLSVMRSQRLREMLLVFVEQPLGDGLGT